MLSRPLLGLLLAAAALPACAPTQPVSPQASPAALAVKGWLAG